LYTFGLKKLVGTKLSIFYWLFENNILWIYNGLSIDIIEEDVKILWEIKKDYENYPYILKKRQPLISTTNLWPLHKIHHNW
jgi:hypothetical protein